MARPGTGRRLLGQTPPPRMLAVTNGFRAERASWRPGGLGSNLAIRDLAIQACAERWPRPESARRHLSLVLDPSRDGVIRQDHRPAPPHPRWRSSSEAGSPPHCHGAACLPPAEWGSHGAAHPRPPLQSGEHRRPEALDRPRGVPGAPLHPRTRMRRLTTHRSVPTRKVDRPLRGGVATLSIAGTNRPEGASRGMTPGAQPKFRSGGTGRSLQDSSAWDEQNQPTQRREDTAEQERLSRPHRGCRHPAEQHSQRR